MENPVIKLGNQIKERIRPKTRLMWNERIEVLDILAIVPESVAGSYRFWLFCRTVLEISWILYFSYISGLLFR